MKIAVVFYSMYGHMHAMAEAALEGAVTVPGAEGGLYRFPETLDPKVLEMLGATEVQKKLSSIPEVTLDVIKDADGIIFGIPTRFGNMLGQARAFFDTTGQLWAQGALIGKVGSVMSSSATQHGGQESTILTSIVTLMHHGMVIVGLPYSFQGQMTIDEISGSSPYGASTITGGKGERMPSENELSAARFQGEYVAEIAKKLST
ncbi:NAD(P)H:quinone oxidoreductase [Sediminispirochaeta bajacaliforniensis]|uniref:NAD(P)H:quinone oxidoreductase n=1 Tax=Sediminispirochaeta bajacaliforniensis TaxID=148 RepID=UPI00035D6929|nr:NAD(P)H:quinone oxidoreductase [Sediminispirochaeta bajacaliforniensis]